jgi:hypothetical protein
VICQNIQFNITIILDSELFSLSLFKISKNLQHINVSGSNASENRSVITPFFSVNDECVVNVESGIITFNSVSIVYENKFKFNSIISFILLNSENSSFLSSNSIFLFTNLSLIKSHYGKVCINNSIFENYSSTLSMFHFSPYNNLNFITNSIFYNISIYGEYSSLLGIYTNSLGFSSFSLENCSLSRLYSSSNDSLFKLNYPSENFNVSIIENYFSEIISDSGECFGSVFNIYGTNITLYLRKNIFDNVMSNSNGTIYICINSTNYLKQNIKSNSFSNCTAKYGGVFYIEWVFINMI